MKISETNPNSEESFINLNKKEQRENIKQRLKYLADECMEDIYKRFLDKNFIVTPYSIRIDQELSSAEIILISWNAERGKDGEFSSIISKDRWIIQVEILSDGSLHLKDDFDAKLPN